MTVSPTQLIGGKFQDSEGNPLALGYLKMKLNQDGSAVTSPAQYVWGNDDIATPNTYYRVTGYTAQGQPAWGPNNQQIISGATFDLGTWVPNTVFSWTPPVQPLLLENNGIPNSSQVLFNLENTDDSITITDEGGGSVNITAAIKAIDAGTGIDVSDSSGTVTITNTAVIALKNNGTTNSSQTVLNLESTDSSVVITDEGSGAINFQVPVSYDIIPSFRNWCLITATDNGGGVFGQEVNCVLSGSNVLSVASTSTLPCAYQVQSNGPRSLWMNASSNNGMYVPVDSNPKMVFRAWLDTAALGSGNDAVCMLMATDVGIPSNGNNNISSGNKIGFYCAPGSGDWNAFVTVGGTPTVAGTGVSSSSVGTEHLFMFITNFAAGTVTFYIDNVLVAIISAMPTSGTIFVREGAWSTYDATSPTINTGIVDVATEYIEFF